jgi:hypothetical protein
MLRDALGCGHEVAVETVDAQPRAELLGCSGAGEHELRGACEPPQLAGDGVEQRAVHARDDDELRFHRGGRLGKGVDRRVGTEKEDPPAVRAEDEAERDQPDVVSFAGRAREDGEGPPPRPALRQIGDEWERGELEGGEEHFATTLIR